MSITRSTEGCPRGCAEARVAHARAQGTKGGRCRSFWVAGAAPATRPSGGGRKLAAAARTSARGRGRRGPGGPEAHPERRVGLRRSRGGRRRQDRLRRRPAEVKKTASLRRAPGTPARSSHREGGGRQGGADGAVNLVRGGLHRWRNATATSGHLGFGRGRAREGESMSGGGGRGRDTDGVSESLSLEASRDRGGGTGSCGLIFLK